MAVTLPRMALTALSRYCECTTTNRQEPVLREDMVTSQFTLYIWSIDYIG